MMDFQEYLESITDTVKRERMNSILLFIKKMFPQLKGEIKWNQPVFSDHNTFIIGFSVALNHIAVAPESDATKLFEKEIDNLGYSRSKELFRIKWTDEIRYSLLRDIIAYNIESKKNMNSYWRSYKRENKTNTTSKHD